MFGRYWFALFFCLPAFTFAEPLGRLTFSEGQIRLVRDANIHAMSDGMVLESSDILETPDPGFALLELSNGTLVALGSQSRLMLGDFAPRSAAKLPTLMLLEGWAKIQAHNPDGSGNISLSTPQLLMSWKTTSLVVHAQPNSSEMFVESGEAGVSPLGKNGKAGSALSAKTAQFLSISAGKPVTVLPRSNDAFLATIPRAFRDALPSRIGKFAEVKTAPRLLNEARYEEIAHWLKAPIAWRNGFVKRFGPRTRDVAFRRGLESDLKQHPEWDRVLHPEKYEPKLQKPSPYSVQPAR